LPTTEAARRTSDRGQATLLHRNTKFCSQSRP
jgi:hypothetical protein